MTLDEFVEKYPSLTRAEIATIAGCKLDLVNRWFLAGDTKRTPTNQHRDRFALADWLWREMDNEPEIVRTLRALKPD